MKDERSEDGEKRTKDEPNRRADKQDEQRQAAGDINLRRFGHCVHYSNTLGAGFGGGGLAASTRETRFDRAAAGSFPHCCSTIFIASSMRSRTMPLAGSIQPTLLSCSDSYARSSVRAFAR